MPRWRHSVERTNKMSHETKSSVSLMFLPRCDVLYASITENSTVTLCNFHLHLDSNLPVETYTWIFKRDGKTEVMWQLWGLRYAGNEKNVKINVPNIESGTHIGLIWWTKKNRVWLFVTPKTLRTNFVTQIGRLCCRLKRHWWPGLLQNRLLKSLNDLKRHCKWFHKRCLIFQNWNRHLIWRR